MFLTNQRQDLEFTVLWDGSHHGANFDVLGLPNELVPADRVPRVMSPDVKPEPPPRERSYRYVAPTVNDVPGRCRLCCRRPIAANCWKYCRICSRKMG